MLKDTGLVKGCVARWFGSQRHGQKALILEGDDSATRERLEGKLASKEMEKKLSIHLELHSMWDSKSVLKQGARGRGTLLMSLFCVELASDSSGGKEKWKEGSVSFVGKVLPSRHLWGFWMSSALGMGNHTPQAQLCSAAALRNRPCLHRPDVCPVLTHFPNPGLDG